MKIKILIVEDDPIMLDMLEGKVKKWGFSVSSAQSGESALKLCNSEEFGLILTDVFLPDTDAEKLIPQMRDTQFDTDIIAMTGSNTSELETKIRALGVLYYLIKPFDIRNLKSILEFVQDRKKNEDYPN